MEVIIIILIIIAIFTYLIILGGNMQKTQEEQEIEDKEQMEYIKDYQNGGNKVGNKKRSKTSF